MPSLYASKYLLNLQLETKNLNTFKEKRKSKQTPTRTIKKNIANSPKMLLFLKKE